MKCSLSALTLALLAGSIGSNSAWAQNVYGPVGFGGTSATLTPAPAYYNARFAPSAAATNNGSQPMTVVAPQSGAPENVATPAPQPGGAFGDIGNGDAYTGWNGANRCGEGGADCGGADYGGADNYCSRWSVWANGLVMGRNMPNKFWTTFETGNNPNQLLYFPGAEWGGGFETGLAYWFGCPTGNGCGSSLNPYCNCCYQNGIEVVYWGLWGLDGQSSLYSPSNSLSTPINLGFVDFDNDPSIQASSFFDNARSHRLTRDDEIHNIELNLLHIPCCTGCDNFHLMWIAGVRYFRFAEALQFGTMSQFAPVGAQFGDSPADEAYLDVDVQNNLVGFQIGGRADYCIHDRWTIFATPKAGIYGNHVTGHNSLYRGNGQQGTFEDTGNPFDINTSENVFSFLASIDVGFTYAISPNWIFTAGYRVVAASQVALGDNQIPAFLAAEDEWRDIDTNGDLILHGGFAGLEFRF